MFTEYFNKIKGLIKGKLRVCNFACMLNLQLPVHMVQMSHVQSIGFIMDYRPDNTWQLHLNNSQSEIM